MRGITNVKIITMEDCSYEKGTVLFEDGKIVAVGENIDVPEGTELVDGSDGYLLPGLIDAHTHIGICEEIYKEEGDDVNEMTSPLTPDLRALDAINPADIAFDDALQGGVTTAMAAPGSANVIGGTVTILKMKAPDFAGMIVREEAGLKVAFGENPKSVYGPQKKAPQTRMANAAILRQALIDGQTYLGKKDAERKLGKENISRVLKKEFPLRAHAHRADDILTALRIADEFGVDIIIEHCTEGHLLTKELKTAGVFAAVGPSLSNRSKVELKDMSFRTPGILAEAGIPVALITDHPVVPIQYLILSAALAHKEGMSEEEALRAVTINPAMLLGIDKRTGSIKAGKDADLVLWDGHPFDIRSRAQKVWIDGEKYLG